jgi:hypothetical protein
LNSLKIIQRIISTDLAIAIESIISNIENNEEIGYFPCAGKNELIQALLTQKKRFIPEASYAIIVPIHTYCSSIYFFDRYGKEMIARSGYRKFIATHPAFLNKESLSLSFETYKMSTYNGITEDLMEEIKADIPLSNINELYISQESFVKSLKHSYESLNLELWNEDLELLDITYNDFSSIIQSIYPKYPRSIVPEYCYVIIGYSESLDNYTIFIGLMENNSYVGDRFVCRSNSLDSVIRNKLNNKTILKIKLK